MVSKNTTLLSLLLPIAMVIGTTIAIEFYKGSPLLIVILFAFGGIMLCGYILILRSGSHRSAR